MKLPPHPRSRKTLKGGKKMAVMTARHSRSSAFCTRAGQLSERGEERGEEERTVIQLAT